MNIEKKEIKRTARRIGFFIMGHQLFFQLGVIVLLIIIGFVSAMLGMEHLEDVALYIVSDLMQLIAGVFFLMFYLVNKKLINSTPMVKRKCTPKSIIFGLIHLNFLQFIFATIMGVVCCYIYEATGKIRYSMLLHLLNNSILVLFNILPITEEVSAVIKVALGIVSLVATIAYLIYKKTKYRVLKTDISTDTKKNCLYFFTSVPMIIFVLACLGICVYMSLL
ncbi:MAG: CPBP family intramembrane glutamic endopeptidase [Acutalibacteraceae bacterium]|nr:CPBP family intramembrane glutamic endopeptidase [Acutalibacteraceae bacterium]